MHSQAPCIEIVSATRRDERDFWSHSALGLSIKRIEHDQRLQVHIAFGNRCGLPTIYNRSIDAEAPLPGSDAILVFVHDDVWLEDFFLLQRLDEGLQRFDVIGLAGNKRRKPFQPAWYFTQHYLPDEPGNLSGAVAHGPEPMGWVTHFGASAAECKLLDGVFLAARRSTLREHEVRFDPRFDFHLYDMDFCRRCEQQQLRMGTWPIAVTHQSSGNFFLSGSWQQAYQKYLDKWGN